MELHRCINFLLSAAQHTVFQCLKEELAPYDITPGQYGVLNCLWVHQELSPKQIGELLVLEASSVSSILDRMQKSGLINRDINPDSRRNILVSATEKGKALKKPVEQIVDDINRQVMRGFSKNEQEFLIGALTSISKQQLKA